jgi:DNA repair exonuclease SbcCD ATPase subunit
MWALNRKSKMGRAKMKRNREDLKAELMAQMEEEIDKLLDWHERTEAPTLAEIEDAVLELRKRMGQRITGEVMMEQEAVRPVPGPACPTCGREMHYKGMKEVSVTGRTGEMRVERAYYHCRHCRRGIFPPG